MARRWIEKEVFEEIETGTKVKVRFIGNGITTNEPIDNEISVLILTGPWKDRDLILIRNQIEKIL